MLPVPGGDSSPLRQTDRESKPWSVVPTDAVSVMQINSQYLC